MLPIQDQERKTKILQGITKTGKQADVLLMCDGTEEMGYVVVESRNLELHMWDMQIFSCTDLSKPDMDARMCIDFLMRSAASYGFHNGDYKIISHIPDIFPVLQVSGFKASGNVAETEVTNIVRVCKSS